MRRIALLLVLAAVLVPAEVAQAGGWATVELGDSPSGLAAGKPWRVELIVKQHGITPMEGVKPSITIVSSQGAERTFAARPTGTIGHYVADVKFPSGGEWSARISDGFTDAVPHRISHLTVSGLAPEGFPWAQVVMSAIVALLFIGGWLAAGDSVPSRERGAAARGRRRATPRPVA
ncbi:MAG TPA: hypothetical protein VFX51_17945 [Solirubrobacteraceae bacterium]|nr:hypothetical protein [Solirubrobacteraceae bacterium]